jgi:hypothetical protein
MFYLSVVSDFVGWFPSLPILQASQNDVDATPISRQQTGGIEQFLEDLIIWSKDNFLLELQFTGPKEKRLFERLRYKRGRYSNLRQVVLAIRIVWVHSIPLSLIDKSLTLDPVTAGKQTRIASA